jgi:hypothetical protein
MREITSLITLFDEQSYAARPRGAAVNVVPLQDRQDANHAHVFLSSYEIG